MSLKRSALMKQCFFRAISGRVLRKHQHNTETMQHYNDRGLGHCMVNKALAVDEVLRKASGYRSVSAAPREISGTTTTTTS